MEATVQGVDVERLLRWSKPKEVNTANGPRLVSRAKPTEEFWELWRMDQRALKAAGVMVRTRTDTGAFEAVLWRELPREETERRAQDAEGSRAQDADLVVPAPPGCEYRGYQRAGIAYASRRAGTYVADEMGTGKSVQAVGVANYFAEDTRTILVVTKQRIVMNWYRELKKWLVRPLSIGVADAKVWPSTDVVIIHFDALHKWPSRLAREWDLVVLDEAHYFKNHRARRTRSLLGYKPTRKEAKLGVAAQDAIKAKRRLALSGTPIENGIGELFSVFHWLCPEKFPSRSGFESKFMTGERGAYGWQWTGPKSLEKLQQFLREVCMIRRLKKDVLTELPPKTRVIVRLDKKGIEEQTKLSLRTMESKREELESAQADYELAKAAGDERSFKDAVASLRVRTKVAFEEMARVRHEDALAKVGKCLEVIKDDLEEIGHCKALIFGHHSDVLRRVQEVFSGSVMVTGETPPQESWRLVNKFQDDSECGPFIGSIRAVGEGLNLTAAALVYFVEEDWVPGRIFQCEDRAHRMGQRAAVLVKHLVVDGTMDANIAAATVDKMKVIDAALDNDKAEIVSTPSFVGNYDSLATRRQLEAEATIVTDAQAAAVMCGLKALSAMGDGLSAVDSRIVAALAGQLRLTPPQAVLGRKVLFRYREQVEPELLMRCGGFDPEK